MRIHRNSCTAAVLILVYQLLPLATSKLMGDSKESDDSAIFSGVLLLVEGGKLQNIEDSSLVILGYCMLPVATSKLMGGNKEFDDSAILLRCFTHCFALYYI